MEIIAKSFIFGAKITEIPTINRDRASGVSKFKLAKWIMKYLYWYFYIVIYSVIHRINMVFYADTYKSDS